MNSPFSGPRTRVLPAAVLACALALTTLSSAVPSRAAGIEARVVSGSNALGIKDSDGSICTQSGGEVADSKAVAGDGKSVTTEHSTVRTIGAGVSDPDDNQTFTLRNSGVASLKARGGLPSKFSFDSRVSVSGEFSKGARSDCRSIINSYSYLTLDSALPPGFMTLRMDVSGDAQGYFDLSGGESDPGVTVYGDSPGRVDYTVFVKGGDYQLGLDAETDLTRPVDASSPTSKAGRVTVRGSYVGLGDATTKARGKAKRYVSLGGQRSCSAGTIVAQVSGKASRARAIDTLKVKVNGKRAAKLRKPRAGTRLSLKAPTSSRTAEVVATVKTTKGRTKTVSRSYAPCSG